MSLDFSTVKTNIYSWVTSILPSIPVIFYQQNSPRPDLPYITLYLTSLIQVGQDFVPRPDNTGNLSIIGDREFTIQIQCYGGDPITTLENLRSSLQKETVLDTLRANKIVYVNQFPINDISALLDTLWEPRATMDILFRIAQSETDNHGLIKTVEIEEILSDGSSTVYDQVVTIAAP